jgi:cysteine desulfurase
LNQTSLQPTAKDWIYLDHNATTPLSGLVKGRLASILEAWGNPSSIHLYGRSPKNIMRDARQKISKMLKANPLELVFTSGGSESNSAVLKSTWNLRRKEGRNRILISAVEHPSVRQTANWLVSQGAEVDIIPVDRHGRFDFQRLRELLGSDVALVSVMFANNETGHLFPIREIATLAHEHGALVHSDCVQALGKVEVDLHDLGVDYATFSAHKFYALKGSGLLYIKKGAPFEPLVCGGGQERSRRGGTENLLAIASLGIMTEQADEIAVRAVQIAKLRDQFEAKVQAEIGGIFIIGAETLRLSNTSSLWIDRVDGETLLMSLDILGIAVSTGAACSSGNPEPSPILLAMGLTRRQAQSSLRVSLGWETTESDMRKFIEALKSVVTRLRSIQQVAEGEQNVSL